MKKKILLILLCVACVVPAYAVFNEKNISQTISVLRDELRMVWEDTKQQDIRHEKASQMAEVQHKDMIKTVRWINELTLILYSQEKGFTLDRTYAADRVMFEYKQFNKRRHPQFMNTGIDAEIERYQRLIEALRLLPPRLEEIEEVPDTLRQEIGEFEEEIENLNIYLDSLVTTSNPETLKGESAITAPISDEEQNLLKELAMYGINSRKQTADKSDDDIFMLSEEAQADRDSCITYAKAILQSYTKQKERIEEDDYYFNEIKRKVQQTYEYADECFKEIRTYIFITGQEKYINVLANLKKYAQDAADDVEQKYGTGNTEQDWEGLRMSQWRGFGLTITIVYSLFHLLIITLIVVLISCVILKNVKPFNTEWFRQTRPLVLLLAVTTIYSIRIFISLLFPLSNSMYIAGIRMLIYFWFIMALLLSLLFGMKKEDCKNGLISFIPALVLGFLLMICRAMFLPDKMIHLTLTPILLFFFIWQIFMIRKFKSSCSGYKNIYRLHNITAVVFGLSLLMAIEGFSLLAMMFLMWWIFQVAALATITSIAKIMRYYERNALAKKKDKYAESRTMVSKDMDGDFIRVTWLFDLAYRALIPITYILSFLGCLWLALGVFNLAITCQDVFTKAFFDFTNPEGASIFQISITKLAKISICFFLFRYLNYLCRSLYRVNKFEKVLNASGNNYIRKNDVNLTLAYNVIGIIIWGLFVFYVIHILRIPLGAVSIVAAGLATGIGLALKDVLNNFIYGIQLMSGRLRVGDILECDGISGTVEKISYQSTEIKTLDGAAISFTNSTLFNKNFQNMTKDSPYVNVSITVSISYGEDVEKVRRLILGALEKFYTEKDKFGRYVIDKKSGIVITFEHFGDSSVNLAINQRVLVESISPYKAEVMELVYKLFNENGIVIPFPQQEVSILNFPGK